MVYTSKLHPFIKFLKIYIDFCPTKCYDTFARQKQEVKNIVSAAKMGRPTDNPRPHKISIRINDESKSTLEAYCSSHNVSKTEAIERGISLLKNDLK